MTVRAPGNDAQTAFMQGPRHRLRVGDDLLLVAFEAGRQCFLERDRLGCNHVHQRPALVARKYRRIERFRILLAGEDQAAARPAQRLVRSAGDDIRDAHRARVEPDRYQARVVRNIRHQQRADAVGDRAKALPVDRERIRGRARDYHLRPVFARESLDLIVIDRFGRGIEPVGHGMVNLAARIDRRAMCQMAAVRERHAEERVAGFEQCRIHREVGLRSGVRLDVRILGVEQFFGALDRQPLRDIDVLAAAVIAFARVALGILVREHRTLRRKHARARVILRRDQFDMVFLPPRFALDCRPQFGVEPRNPLRV